MMAFRLLKTPQKKYGPIRHKSAQFPWQAMTLGLQSRPPAWHRFPAVRPGLSGPMRQGARHCAGPVLAEGILCDFSLDFHYTKTASRPARPIAEQPMKDSCMRFRFPIVIIDEPQSVDNTPKAKEDLIMGRADLGVLDALINSHLAGPLHGSRRCCR